ncbi:tetratricopeptide repeat-containing protein [Pseudooceanicola batsensis]|uniref:tetratricopeptide repeat-containing protein n=1 Tax=Pseudooceanicola batsensis TaxID=314255 RepID=UPI001375487F|nr:tetratricopeptide repeat-containing protein [Pseudooceanicola batsensis]
MAMLRRLIGWFSTRGSPVPDPHILELRKKGRRAAVIFLHGFSGTADGTWTDFSRLFVDDPEFSDWDAFSIGYPSRLSLDFPLWEADPGIRLCARSLATKLTSRTLAGYDCIALVAHSMGGLVAQRAVLDSSCFDGRLSHLVLFGTPSAGLAKAGLARLLKFQLRDMDSGGAFISQLRTDWAHQFGAKSPFAFISVAGEVDAFVPSTSSLDPFPVSQQAAIPGNHLDIVRPATRDDLAYDIVRRLLRGNAPLHSVADTARLAVERREFQSAIDILEPIVSELDDNAIVTLSLALESLGRSQAALNVIETWADGRDHLDPRGVLAGRLKRRWLLERRQTDFDRALSLYNESRAAAISAGNFAQAYYQGINVAFLHLASSADHDPIPQAAVEAARLALEHVELAPPSPWGLATRGEALLVLGCLEDAVAAYRDAIAAATSVRAKNSMYVQATAVTVRIYGADARDQIDHAFGIVRS